MTPRPIRSGSLGERIAEGGELLIGASSVIALDDRRPRISATRYGGTHLADVPKHAALTPTWPIPPGIRRTDLEQSVFVLVNEHRATLSGVSGTQLRYDTAGALDYCAGWKTLDMSRWMYMQHDQPSEDPSDAQHPSTISDRFTGCGYSPYAAWGENIAYGLETPADVMAAWMSDLGHRQNLEGPWAYIGVGVVQASNGLIFWTQDFGTEHDPVTPAPAPGPEPTPPANAPKPGSEWRKKASHRYVVIVDSVTRAGKGALWKVAAHHPGDAPGTLPPWLLVTFLRNFEPVPTSSEEA